MRNALLILGVILCVGLSTQVRADDKAPSTVPSKPSPAAAGDTETRLVRIFARHFGVEAKEISRKTRLKEDLKADDLDTVEIVMELEDAFEIAIPDAATERLKTVGHYVDYVNQLRTTMNEKRR